MTKAKFWLLFLLITAVARISDAQWEVVPDTSTPAALEETLKKYEALAAAQPEPATVAAVSVSNPGILISISPDIALPQTELVWDADTLLLEKFNGSASGEIFGSISYIDSIPNLNKALSLSQGSWIRYTPAGLALLENAGSVEFFVAPTAYNTGLLTLQWLRTNTQPSWGFVLWVTLSPDGKISCGAWNWGGFVTLLGTTSIPLNTWSHIGITWDNAGSKIYINGKLDASTPQKMWPASPRYGYLGYWGVTSNVFLDEFRISKVARIRELAKPKVTLAKWSGDNQSRTVTKSLQQPLTARVNDAQGSPKAGIAVSFQSKSSPQGQAGFTVAQTQPTTDAQGLISANVVLGNKSGTYEISATCNDCEPGEIVFTANATPAALIKYSGDKQIGVVGGVIANPLTVKTSDQLTNTAVSNIGVNFQLQVPSGSSGYSLNPVSTTTDSQGLGRTVLTLGDKQGDYTVTANSPDAVPQAEFKACGRLDVPDVKQYEGGWEGKLFNSTTYTISALGCPLAAISDVLRFHDIDTDPLKLNKWLKDNKGFTGPNVEFKEIPKYVKTFSKEVTYEYMSSPSDENISVELNSSRPPIIQVVSLSDPARKHFLVATANCFGTFAINDPGHNAIAGKFAPLSTLEEYYRHLSVGKRKILSLRKILPGSGDNSGLIIIGRSPIETLLIDPLGRKTGYNPVDASIINEIPHSGYEQDASIGIDSEEDVPASEQPPAYSALEVTQAMSGEYKIQLFGKDTGEYKLSMEGNTADAETSLEQEYPGLTEKNRITEFRLNFNKTPGQISMIAKIVTFQSLKDDLRLAKQLGFVDNDGILNSLTKKLENAEEQYNKGQKEAAKNMLEALINEVTAQTDKHIKKAFADPFSADIAGFIKTL